MMRQAGFEPCIPQFACWPASGSVTALPQLHLIPRELNHTHTHTSDIHGACASGVPECLKPLCHQHMDSPISKSFSER